MTSFVQVNIQPTHFRDRRNYYLACAAEWLSPIIRFFDRITRRQAPTAPYNWRKGVILGASHLGDILYRTGSLEKLQQNLPDCAWYYLTEKNSAPLLRGHIPSERIITFPTDLQNPWTDPEVIARCQAHQFDVALCTSSISHWHELLFSFKLRIPNRCALTYKGFSAFVTHPIKSVTAPTPGPKHFRAQVAEISQKEPPSWNIRPRVLPAPEGVALANQVLEKYHLTPENSFAIALTTRQSAAVWPPVRFAALAKKVAETLNRQIVLLGSVSDAETLHSLSTRHALNAVVLPGILSLGAIVPFLRGIGFLICTDSGVRHLANAASIPVFYFRNLSQHEAEACPYLETEYDLCPSTNFTDQAEQIRIFQQIEPSDILTKITDALARQKSVSCA